jgi:phosphate uptake regulator
VKLHRVTFEAHENALQALFTRDIALAETVRNERRNVMKLFSEVESIVRGKYVDVAPKILATTASISRIYDHSLDIADLVMPKIA